MNNLDRIKLRRERAWGRFYETRSFKNMSDERLQVAWAWVLAWDCIYQKYFLEGGE